MLKVWYHCMARVKQHSYKCTSLDGWWLDEVHQMKSKMGSRQVGAFCECVGVTWALLLYHRIPNMQMCLFVCVHVDSFVFWFAHWCENMQHGLVCILRLVTSLKILHTHTHTKGAKIWLIWLIPFVDDSQCGYVTKSKKKKQKKTIWNILLCWG